MWNAKTLFILLLLHMCGELNTQHIVTVWHISASETSNACNDHKLSKQGIYNQSTTMQLYRQQYWQFATKTE